MRGMAQSAVTDFPYLPADEWSFSRRRKVHGVGINDAPYVTQIDTKHGKLKCPFYALWTSMMGRGYSPAIAIKQPAYKDVTVAREWHFFTKFKAWMEKQDWIGKQLDKDLLVPGNTEYSPDRCIFVSQAINALFKNHNKSHGPYPMGVYLHLPGRYRAAMTKSGKSVHLGLYDTPEEAYAAYCKAKSEHIRDVANGEDEPLRSALIRHADIMANTDNIERKKT